MLCQGPSHVDWLFFFIVVACSGSSTTSHSQRKRLKGSLVHVGKPIFGREKIKIRWWRETGGHREIREQIERFVSLTHSSTERSSLRKLQQKSNEVIICIHVFRNMSYENQNFAEHEENTCVMTALSVSDFLFSIYRSSTFRAPARFYFRNLSIFIGRKLSIIGEK